MNQQDHWQFTLDEWSKSPFVELLDVIKKGDTVYDVGANVGGWSKLAVDKGATVYAFEPQKDNFQSLLRNVKAFCINSGIYYGYSALPALNTTDSNCGAFSVEPSLKMQTTGEMFRLTPLEDYPIPDVIKIDVEGAEKNIIKHSTNLKKIPVIILEWHYEDSVEDFISKYLPHRIITNIENKMLLLKL